MKRTVCSLLLAALAILLPSAAHAAPVAPELQLSLTPADGLVRPGQLAVAFVGGGFPLEVEGTLDGEAVPFFWNGDGYIGFVSFELETPPGAHRLAVSATGPGNGQRLDYQTTLMVEEDPYPREYVTINGPLIALLDPALNQDELDRIGELVEPVSHRLEWEWPFAFPAVAKVTSLFGGDRTYNGDQLRGRHTGLDFRMPEGAVVHAAAAGRVVSAEPFDIRGNVVILDHGWGVYTLYAHLSAIEVAEGDEVETGQAIGKAGRTGRSTGTHLHWEVIVNGHPVDPLVWMALSPVYIQPAVDDRAGQATS